MRSSEDALSSQMKAAENAVVAELQSRFDGYDPYVHYSQDFAEDFVEWLVLERQDLLGDLHEHPSRWWFMQRERLFDNVGWPVWRGGDEFDHRPWVIWWPRKRWLVLNLRPWPLNTKMGLR